MNQLLTNMISNASTPEDYISNLPKERVAVIQLLRNTILDNLPKGFEELMSYGMIGYVVPHSLYPKGYHCDTKLPLPFMSFASQKNTINFYHMGIYINTELYNWFVSEYALFSKKKLDMGKSCMRFKKIDDIPFDLIGQLVKKISVSDWITTYETTFKK